MPKTDTESFDVIEATIDEVHAAIETHEITAESLVDSYLTRIDEYDDDLHSILTVNPNARQRAKQLDSQFDTDGFVGPLHGVPIIVKDNQDTHDMPTTAGSKALAESVPSQDAFIVERLRNAGGVILAKANLQEFSYGVDTISSLGGETRNAYALDRRPSGSSGGTAAAIAANLGVIGTGSDTCSSVRSPPAFNNLVGFRPTRGLVSRTGIIPLSETQDTAGPITRTVTDAARMLDVLSGYDPADPITAQSVANIPDDGYVSYLDEHGLDGARIGVVRAFFGLQNEESAPESAATKVTSVIETAIDEMEAAGATIVDPVEVIDQEFLASARVIPYEFKRDFDHYLAELEDEPPYRTLAEIIGTGQVAEAIESRIATSELLDVDVETLDENREYLQRLERRHQIKIDTVQRLVDQNLDALLYPPSTIPPVKLPNNQSFDELPCELAAHTGLPSIVVQAGFTDDGLPVGVELLGRAFAEPRLFELAYSYEQATKHRQPPAGFGESP
ncbi:amidase family protein [Haladaptatus pallidirubidus]|uniref:Amidase family protein n=1 Tax=Haladaptatus pallidirubidus TaxID=1008152 RepID=A0AAV3URM2_9EURY|nr:amidase family protein [Haladaptatus pallidirubidus]